jgi:hypothetical protein
VKITGEAANRSEIGADATASLVYASVTHVDPIKEIAQATALRGDAHIVPHCQQRRRAATPEPTTLPHLDSSFIALG